MEHSIDLGEIGRTYPQHQEMGRGYDYDAPDSIHKVPWERFARFEPNFRTVVLAGVAKPTDLVSSAPLVFSGLLVSGRLLALLGFARLPRHKVYPVPVLHRQRSVAGYSWVHIPPISFEVPAGTTTERIQAAIAASRFAKLDLFMGMGETLPQAPGSGLGPVWFVSDRLRGAVIAIGLTGVVFRETVLPEPSFRDAGPNIALDSIREAGRGR